MNKKVVNIVLLSVVLVVWGGVIYRFAKSFFSSNEAPPIVYNTSVDFKNYDEIVKDSFDLVLLDRDPFLGKVSSKSNQPKKVVKKKPTAKRVSKPAPKKIVYWPNSIQYYGYLKSGARSRALIRVEGKMLKLKVGQNITDDIFVKDIHKDSLLLSDGQSNRVLYKN